MCARARGIVGDGNNAIPTPSRANERWSPFLGFGAAPLYLGARAVLPTDDPPERREWLGYLSNFVVYEDALPGACTAAIYEGNVATMPRGMPRAAAAAPPPPAPRPPPPPARPPPPPVRPPPPPPPSAGGTTAGCSVEVVATDGVSGYTTIRLKCELPDGAANVYAIAGTPETSMRFPPAFQVPAPFGSDFGPTNAAFFPLNAAAEFDSFVTIGMEGPALQSGALSSIGIDFSVWSESVGIETDDGAVFFMDPEHGKLQDHRRDWLRCSGHLSDHLAGRRSGWRGRGLCAADGDERGLRGGRQSERGVARPVRARGGLGRGWDRCGHVAVVTFTSSAAPR